jgi:hypothetical protein
MSPLKEFPTGNRMMRGRSCSIREPQSGPVAAGVNRGPHDMVRKVLVSAFVVGSARNERSKAGDITARSNPGREFVVRIVVAGLGWFMTR